MNDAAPSRISVATVTLVREPGEEAVLRRSMAALAQLGWPVYVADGGSGTDFVSFVRSLPGVSTVNPDGAGLVGQVRGSLTAAARSGTQFVLYTESDKQQFFEQSLRSFIADAPLDASVGAVLAARTTPALETFPPMQRFAEGTINDLCREFLGVPGDYSYGPFLLESKLAAALGDVPDDAGWGWRHFVFAVAHRTGKRIVHVSDEYLCPQDQRDEDERERIHRLRQLGQNVNGLLAGLTSRLRDLPSA